MRAGEWIQVECKYCGNARVLQFDPPIAELRCPKCLRLSSRSCVIVPGQVIDYWESEVDLLDQRAGIALPERY